MGMCVVMDRGSGWGMGSRIGMNTIWTLTCECAWEEVVALALDIGAVIGMAFGVCFAMIFYRTEGLSFQAV